jgi:hypothetical protein
VGSWTGETTSYEYRVEAGVVKSSRVGGAIY